MPYDAGEFLRADFLRKLQALRASEKRLAELTQADLRRGREIDDAMAAVFKAHNARKERERQ